MVRKLLKTGGQGRNRTADASLFRAALYRLSYLAGKLDCRNRSAPCQTQPQREHLVEKLTPNALRLPHSCSAVRVYELILRQQL